MKTNRLFLLLPVFTATMAAAQEPSDPPQGHRPPPPPLLAALDTDENDELSAEEISNAPASLAKLDQDQDGTLSREELLPPPPEMEDANATSDPNGAPPPPGKMDGGRPPGGPGPILSALDTDQDGVLSAAEIAAAPTTLLTLDTNGDGIISREELAPAKPQKKSGRSSQGKKTSSR